MKNAKRALAICALSALSACGGDGAPATQPPSHSTATFASGSLELAIPTKTTQSTGARPLFLSPSASSVSIAVTGIAQPVVADVSATSTQCVANGGTRTCTIAVRAPLGNDTFTATIYAGAGATGAVLGVGTAAKQIASGAAFTIAIGVDGKAVSIRILAARTQFAAGTPATTALTVNALDASGNVITGSYGSAITITNSDTTGTFTIAPTSVTQSGQAVSLTYTGGAAATTATISANAAAVPTTGVLTQIVSVGTPALASQTYALPGITIPNQFAPGPGDANMWYADASFNATAGRIAIPGYAISSYPMPVDPVNGQPSYGMGITAASDGNLYYGNTQCSVLKVTAAGVATVLSSIAACPQPGFLTQGPDGALWVMLYGTSQIGRFPLSGAAPTIFTVPTPNSLLYNSQITTGPDGALWFTEKAVNKIGRLTTSGAFTEYPVSAGSYPQGIVSPADGNIWFTEPGRSAIGKLTPTGTLTEYTIPGVTANPAGLTIGKDGNLYFSGSPYAGKVNLAGAVTLYTVGGNGTMGDSIATGSDGKLYTVLGTGVSTSPYELLVFPPQ